MSKGNPLWETSYHSRATIQIKKLKKIKKQNSSWNWATSAGRGPAQNLTRASFYSSCWSSSARSLDHHHWAKLPREGHVLGTHLDVVMQGHCLCRLPHKRDVSPLGMLWLWLGVPTRRCSENAHKGGPDRTPLTFLTHALRQPPAGQCNQEPTSPDFKGTNLKLQPVS